MNGWLIGLGVAVFIALLALLSYLVTLRMFLNMCCRRQEQPDRNERFLAHLSASPLAHRVENVRQGIEWLRVTEHDALTIQSRDGLKLQARLYRNPQWNGKVVLLCHGYCSSAEHDFSTLCPIYYRMGFHLLLPDQRSHNRSEGKYICFGAKEQYDVLDWCRALKNEFGEHVPVVLSGLSMGCTTVLMAAGLLEAPANIRAVVADCGFINANEQFRHVLRWRYHLPGFPLLPICNRICLHRAGYSIREWSTLKALDHIRVPILFFHGERDRFVPPHNSLRMYQQYQGPKELVMVKDAGHGQCWIADEEKCSQALKRLICRMDEII